MKQSPKGRNTTLLMPVAPNPNSKFENRDSHGLQLGSTEAKDGHALVFRVYGLKASGLKTALEVLMLQESSDNKAFRL